MAGRGSSGVDEPDVLQARERSRRCDSLAGARRRDARGIVPQNSGQWILCSEQRRHWTELARLEHTAHYPPSTAHCYGANRHPSPLPAVARHAARAAARLRGDGPRVAEVAAAPKAHVGTVRAGATGVLLLLLCAIPGCLDHEPARD